MVALKRIDRKTGLVVESGLIVALLLGAGALPAKASGVDDVELDAGVLMQMEQHAASADVRDQCFLYAEVVQGFTNLAGREMAAGDEEKAAATMRHVDEIAAKMHAATLKDAKRLKPAELLMDRTTRHLADMVRVASEEQRAVMQRALQHLNSVHSELLATVFSR